MNRFISRIFYYIIALMAVVAMALSTAPEARALPAETYAPASRLASGRWVKIAVAESGVYLLSTSQLRSMGFSDPEKVNVYGYGATVLPDVLDESYIDDLPLVQSECTPQGVIFYAVGPNYWRMTNGMKTPDHNHYTLLGYYFVSDVEAERPEIAETGNAGAQDGVDTFIDNVYHEQELTSIGQTGHMLLGEDFMFQTRRSFTLDLPGRVEGTPVHVGGNFMAGATSTTSLTVTVNNKPFGKSPLYINQLPENYGHYREVMFSKDIEDITGTRVTIGLSYDGGNAKVKGANLNFLTASYTRTLQLVDGKLPFEVKALSRELSLGGASESTRVWDVTNPASVYALKTKINGNRAEWTATRSGDRSYYAFDIQSLPQPEVVGDVAAQNIHGIATPDMVIFVPRQWRAQAQRIADMHAQSADSLRVEVLCQDDVFNEFSSGSADVQAFRKCLKMFYDRGQSDSQSRKLRYALFFGRGIYDNRQVTAPVKALNFVTMPIWQTETGASDTDSFTTDDILAFLEDGSGAKLGTDHYSIAVGRMPVTSVTDATQAVNKLIEYKERMPYTSWRNTTLHIADDDDNGIHLQQSEAMVDAMRNSIGGADISYKKVYTDAYDLIGGGYPGAREEMYKILNEGVAWWTFIGHANPTSWTAEGVLTYTDVNTLYLRTYPIVYAATCDFLRWDSRMISAAEIMWRLESGGCIGVIAANRPVYISDNGNLSLSFGREVFNRGEDGRRLTLGEIFQRAKNNITSKGRPVNDTNKLRYGLLGDPAMRPAVPDLRAIVTEINGVEVGDENQPVLQARQDAVMRGYIADAEGNKIEDYNGIVSSTLFDAEFSVTTKGNGSKGKVMVFDRQGHRLFAGNDSVRGGEFEVKIAMPSSITNNYRPAAVNLYATTGDKTSPREACGMNRDFYVFGTDYSVVDDEAPVIRSFYLNHPSFVDGQQVNPSPMAIAEISDNRGLNMSIVGLGHQMHLQLDGKISFPNVADYFTPSATDPTSGTIAFPLSSVLTEGEHTLRLRVWDTSDNSTEQTITFEIINGIAPEIIDVYTDANPAIDHANFYLSHNRPDAVAEVTITVYNMLGREVWSATQGGRSDMFMSAPVSWDLRDKGGSRVSRGIYLYRATIRIDGVESSSAVRRLAVAAQ